MNRVRFSPSGVAGMARPLSRHLLALCMAACLAAVLAAPVLAGVSLYLVLKK